MFFFVNGFLLFKKELNLKKHIEKTLRLIAIALFWGFAIPLIIILATGYECSLKEYLNIAWFYKIGWNNQLWFIGALVCIYFLFPLLKVAFDNYRPAFIFFTVTCFILTFGNVFLDECATIGRHFYNGNNGLVDFNFFGRFNLFQGIPGYSFVYFCFGGLYREKIDSIILCNKRKRNLIATLAILVMLLLYYFWALFASSLLQKSWDNVYNGYSTIFVFVITIALFTLCLSYRYPTPPHLINRLISLISKNTLGIFIIHYPLSHILRFHFAKYFELMGCFAPFFNAIVYPLLILFASLAIALVLKKLPLLKLFV